MVNTDGLLFFEPSSVVSEQPVIDALTRKLTAAWRTRRRVVSYNGLHQCACGILSDDSDWAVGTEPQWSTNALCLHYLAYHRCEVPAQELAKVDALPESDAEPTEQELRPPPRTRAERLARVPADLKIWLGRILLNPPSEDGYKGAFTALDQFLLTGRVTIEINPTDLPVPEAELANHLRRLHNVWHKPFGDAFGGEHHIAVKIGTAGIKLKIQIAVWMGLGK